MMALKYVKAWWSLSVAINIYRTYQQNSKGIPAVPRFLWSHSRIASPVLHWVGSYSFKTCIAYSHRMSSDTWNALEFHNSIRLVKSPSTVIHLSVAKIACTSTTKTDLSPRNVPEFAQTPSAAEPHQQLQKLRLVKPGETKAIALVGGFNCFNKYWKIMENLP